jgi:hypothetical protein
MHEGSAKTWLPSKGVAPLLKAILFTCVLNRCELSLLQHAPRFSPPRRGGWVPHVMQAGPREKKPNRHAARCMQPPGGYKHSSTFAQTSGRKSGQPSRWHATVPSGRALRLQQAQHRGLGPRVMQPARRVLRVSNCTATHATTAPTRLRSRYRDSRQPCRAGQARRSNAVKIGPAVMAVTGGQKQRSHRQPSSRPIQGQRGSPLSRHVDGAPVICSSNGSRTRNGRPANRSPRRINSAAG